MSQDNSAELLPCPFCRGAPVFKPKRSKIWCSSCDCELSERPGDSLHGEFLSDINARLIGRWNTRAAASAPSGEAVAHIPFDDDADHPKTWRGLALSCLADMVGYAHDETPQRRLVSANGWAEHANRLHQADAHPAPAAGAMPGREAIEAAFNKHIRLAPVDPPSHDDVDAHMPKQWFGNLAYHVTPASKAAFLDALASQEAGQPSDEWREAIEDAFIAGATAVHNEWLATAERGEGPPRGDPEFGEAASDYAASVEFAQPSAPEAGKR
jgi:hypothetical protein